jgi:UDP-N-acetylmuramate--alanine ligase
VADAAVGQTLVAVAGTHGKSTTAGWLTWVLAEAGLDPAAFVGALLPAALTGGVPATARQGSGAPFVVEADEYAGNFDAYRPDIVVLTTIEWDHPDVFADRADVLDAFEAWLLRVPDATLVASLGDQGVHDLLVRISDRPGAVVGVGVEDSELGWLGPDEPIPWPPARPGGYVSGVASTRGPQGTSLWLFDHRTAKSIGTMDIPLWGRHNAVNGAVVAIAALELGVPLSAVVSGVASFPGIGRRLERKGEARGVVVYDDYGHHPTAVRATIEAMRQREPGRRLWAVYEPLTFHRTVALLDDFAAALAEADAVAVADIWASRDPDTTITSPGALAAAVRVRRPDMTAVAPGSVEDTASWLAQHVAPGDAVLVMGGGRSYRIAELLLEALGADRG